MWRRRVVLGLNTTRANLDEQARIDPERTRDTRGTPAPSPDGVVVVDNGSRVYGTRTPPLLPPDPRGTVCHPPLRPTGHHSTKTPWDSTPEGSEGPVGP